MSDNLTAALAAFQAELPEIRKTETAKVPTKSGGSYSYTYADLATISKVVLPMLAKHGLAWATNPTWYEGRLHLHYELRHTSGETIEGYYPLTGATPQEIGSSITYARRYCLCSVTGVAPESDDDDAAAASHKRTDDGWEQASRPPTHRQVEVARGLFDAIDGAVSVEALAVVWESARDARTKDDITEWQGAQLRKQFDAKLAALRAEPVGDGGQTDA